MIAASLSPLRLRPFLAVMMTAAAILSAFSLTSCQNRMPTPEIIILTPGAEGDLDDPVPVDFASDIKPVLETRCLRCHYPGSTFTGLSFASKSDFDKAAQERQLVVPGEAERSSMFLVVVLPQYFVEAMPPDSHQLSHLETWMLYHWIQQGAQWPDDHAQLELPARLEMGRSPDDRPL